MREASGPRINGVGTRPSYLRVHKVRKVCWTLVVAALVSLGVAWSLHGEKRSSTLDSDAGPWSLSLGPEFPGAQGQLEPTSEDLEGNEGMRLSADFRLGGAYVAAEIDLRDRHLPAGQSFDLSYRTDRANELTIRATDSHGQVFQRRVPLQADARRRQVAISFLEDAWPEYWGGAGDGVFRGSPASLAIIVNHVAWPDKRPSLEILAFEARVPSDTESHVAESTVFDFETVAEEMEWMLERTRIIGIDHPDHRSRALVFAREEFERGVAVAAASPLFRVGEGALSVSARAQAALSSPDNSYRLNASIRFFDSTKQPIGERPMFEVAGETEIATVRGHAAIPGGAQFARLQLALEKAWGQVWVDDFVVVQRAREADTAPPVRIEAWSGSLANLFKPGDEASFTLKISGAGAPPSASASLNCYASAYAGARVTPSVQLDLDTVATAPEGWSFESQISFPGTNFEPGKYYALELALEDAGRALGQERYGFCILPPAANNQLDPSSSPFTARNWDGRIDEYLRLASRLGVRVVNLWGGWKAQEPHEPWLVNVELARELDLQWIMVSPAMKREAGDASVSNEDLRAGMFTFLKKYADQGLFAISTGNEPHGSDEQVADYVEAYQAIYQGVKAFDETIEVIASSTGPDERYWQHGIGLWCDSYDFHVYQGYLDIERTFAAYRELMQSFDSEKPIRSTELGLNSQGMPRHVVAGEVWKSLSTFLAQGGKSASWFGFLYPDPEGTEQNTSGQAHCMFASRYNRYSPKLDAIAYYHFINQIGERKHVASRRFANGSVVHQFKSDRKGSVLIAWNDAAAATLNLPLAEGSALDVLQVDGTRRNLRAGVEGLSLGLDDVPLLLSVEDAFDLELAGEEPQLAVVECPVVLARGKTGHLSIACSSDAVARVMAYLDSREPLELAPRPEGLWSIDLAVAADEEADALWLELVAWDSDGRPVAQRRARILIRE